MLEQVLQPVSCSAPQQLQGQTAEAVSQCSIVAGWQLAGDMGRRGPHAERCATLHMRCAAEV